MISNKLKTRHIRTTHSVAMKRIAGQINQIPAEKRDERQRQFLEEFADEQKGITTIADVHERLAQKAAEEKDGATADATARAQAEKAAADKKAKTDVAAAKKAAKEAAKKEQADGKKKK